jgi:hypothetical protein
MDVEFRKPEVIPRKLDPTRQQAFIEAYDNLLNNLQRPRPDWPSNVTALRHDASVTFPHVARVTCNERWS